MPADTPPSSFGDAHHAGLSSVFGSGSFTPRIGQPTAEGLAKSGWLDTTTHKGDAVTALGHCSSPTKRPSGACARSACAP